MNIEESKKMAENMYSLCIEHSTILKAIKEECEQGRIDYETVSRLCVLRELIVENSLTLARYCLNEDNC